MLTQFDTTLPSIKQVQTLIKQKTPVEFKLMTGDILKGKILWQDQSCLLLMGEDNQQNTVWKQAIAFMRVSSDG